MADFSLMNNITNAIPRIARRAGAFALHYVPEQIDGFLGRIRFPTLIAEQTLPVKSNESFMNATTSSGIANALRSSASSSAATAPQAAGAAGAAAAQSTAESAVSAAGSFVMLSLQSLKAVGSVFSYAFSKWALTTFAVVCMGRPNPFSVLSGHLEDAELTPLIQGTATQSDPSLRVYSNTPYIQVADAAGVVSDTHSRSFVPNTVTTSSHEVSDVPQLACLALRGRQEA